MENKPNIPGGDNPQQNEFSQQPMGGNPQQQYAQQPVDGQYQQPYVQPVPGGAQKKKSKAWIWIIVAAVLVCAAVVFAVVVLGGGNGQKGNAGVLAVFDYIREVDETEQNMMGDTQKELSARLLEEPFEMVAEVEIGSDMIAELGLPINSITLDVETKYDMKDFGLKATALGMVEFGAYLIEDDVVLDVMGETAKIPIDLPIEADLSKSMNIKERAMAFLPFLPDDNTMAMGLMGQLAMAVPDKYTENEKVDVYSPMDDDEVEMDAITTTLDVDAMVEVVNNLAEGLEEDEALREELQNFINDFTDYFGLDDADIDDAIDEMKDVSKSEDAEDIEFLWSVYQREGHYVGISFYVEGMETDMKAIFMTEFSGKDEFVYAQTFADGVEMQEQTTQFTLDGNNTEFSIATTQTQPTLDENIEISMLFEGESELKKDGKDGYNEITNFTGEVKLPEGIDGVPSDITFDCTIGADILVGDNLDTLKDSKDWGDIYDKDWGDIEDLFEGLNSLGGLM